MRIFILIISMLLAFAIAFGQENLSSSNQPNTLRIINADVMERVESSDGHVREYRGNVKFQHDLIFTYSDTAIQYFEENTAELKGNVVIIQNEMTMKTPKAYYNANSGTARAFHHINIVDSNAVIDADEGKYSTKTYIADFAGNVKIIDEPVVITADSAIYNRKTLTSNAYGNVIVDDDSAMIYSGRLIYNRNTRKSETFENVVIIGKYNNVILTGDTVINIPAENYTIATGNPVLFQIDTIKSNLSDSSTIKFIYDTLTIACDKMEAIRETDKQKYIFTGNVEIVKGNVLARANKSIYFKENEMFFLEGSPIVWYDSTQLHADSILIYMPNNKLKLIHAFGNALAVSISDSLNPSRKNQIIGKTIKIFIDDNNINKIDSYGDAKSLYFMASDQGNDGFARNSSDTIIVNFVDKAPNDVIWLGAVDGEYFPENMIYDKVEEFSLPNFRWSDSKPKKKKLLLPTN